MLQCLDRLDPTEIEVIGVCPPGGPLAGAAGGRRAAARVESAVTTTISLQRPEMLWALPALLALVLVWRALRRRPYVAFPLAGLVTARFNLYARSPARKTMALCVSIRSTVAVPCARDAARNSMTSV